MIIVEGNTDTILANMPQQHNWHHLPCVASLLDHVRCTIGATSWGFRKDGGDGRSNQHNHWIVILLFFLAQCNQTNPSRHLWRDPQHLWHQCFDVGSHWVLMNLFPSLSTIILSKWLVWIWIYRIWAYRIWINSFPQTDWDWRDSEEHWRSVQECGWCADCRSRWYYHQEHHQRGCRYHSKLWPLGGTDCRVGQQSDERERRAAIFTNENKTQRVHSRPW